MLYRRVLLLTLGVGVLAGCSVDSARSRYTLAEKFWHDGKYAAAVAEFEKVEQKDPKGRMGAQARFRGALTQTLYLNQHTEALRKFRLFIDTVGEGTDTATDVEVAREVWDAQKQIGEILFVRTEQYEAAILHYRTLLKSKPTAEEAPEFLFRIAKSHFFLWQFETALETYRELIAAYPTGSYAERAWFEIPVVIFTEGKGNSIPAYEEFIRRFPQSPLVVEAQFGVASAYEEADQLDEAEKRFLALKETYPTPGVIEIKLTRINERKERRRR